MTSTALSTFAIQHVKIISSERQVFKNRYFKITSITGLAVIHEFGNYNRTLYQSTGLHTFTEKLFSVL
jgi:hypothetical protein